MTSAGTYIISPSAASIVIKLPTLTTGSIFTLYGGGIYSYDLTGVDTISTLNGTIISNGDLKLSISSTSTVVCISTSTTSWVVYENGVYNIPS